MTILDQMGYKTGVFPSPRRRRQVPWAKEQLLIAQWLRKLPKPLGLFAANDDRAQDALDACKLAGIKVPDDIAVLGVDNDRFLCELTTPPLSSIAINFEKAGYQAAAALHQIITQGQAPPPEVLIQPTGVISRQSTDILAIDDPELVTALRFIRNQSRRAITVTDVVQVTSLAQRTLQQRFQETLGRSIIQEIQRSRVEQVSQLLIETNLPVNHIARELQYWDTTHIARYFKRLTGFSPKAYRTQRGHISKEQIL